MSIDKYKNLIEMYEKYKPNYVMSSLRKFSVEPTYSVLKLKYDTYKKKYINTEIPDIKKGGANDYIPIIVI